MANPVFPQLSSGALVQFPVRKTRVARTIRNILSDGSLVAFADTAAARLRWQLAYSNLSVNELGALSALFAACEGRLRAFTFIDPTDNMLGESGNFAGVAWGRDPAIAITGGTADPNGGQAAFTMTNDGQIAVTISQTIPVPAGYQYCFSVFAWSAAPSALQLLRIGATAQDQASLAIGPQWSRLVSSGQLNDGGNSFSIAIGLQPGQQVTLYGPQLEAQVAPSRYRATVSRGGIYPYAHWNADELLVSEESPGLFSTSFEIETAL